MRSAEVENALNERASEIYDHKRSLECQGEIVSAIESSGANLLEAYKATQSVLHAIGETLTEKAREAGYGEQVERLLK